MTAGDGPTDRAVGGGADDAFPEPVHTRRVDYLMAADPRAGLPRPARAKQPGAESMRPAPAVRPFLLTSGRVAGGQGLVAPLPVETQVVATRTGLAALDTFAFEHRDIVAVCQEPQSLAEIAAKLRMHLNVIRVLADDLRVDGQLTLYVPQGNAARDASVLRRVIDGLRAVPDSRGALRDF